ncbi:tape measure protein [Bifidobacterium dentium]|uniref:tape measure protein n=1 Tax=Bifidobacterium dentium TaxID=1689 RepID=UPI003D17351F
MSGTAAWIDVLPNLSAFSTKLNSGVNASVTSAGRNAGKKFADAMKQAAGTSNPLADQVKALESAEKRAANTVNQCKSQIVTAREAEKTATLKVQAAEAKLTETTAKYGSSSSQAISAQSRLNDARSKARQKTEAYKSAEEQLKSAQNGLKETQSQLKGAQDNLNSSTSKSAGFFRSAADSARNAVNSFKSMQSSVSSSSASGIADSTRFFSAWSAAKFGAIAGFAQSAFSKVASVISENVGGAITRADTMNNFPKVMKNLGYNADDAAAAIKRISSSLDGLPTSTASMVGMVQQLAPLTSNLDEATSIALAFNNAVLAGGKDTTLQANAIEQYNQMLSANKVDAAAWRSMVNAMPGQINQLAKSMLGANASQNDLYSAMKGGKITFSDFNKALVKLNTEGYGQYASFTEQAKDATQGIGTAVTNTKNRIQKAIQKVVEALGTSNISDAINKFSGGFSKVGDIAADTVTNVKTKVSAVTSYLKTGELSDEWKKAFGTASWAPQLQSTLDGIRSTCGKAFDSIKESAGKLADSWSKLIPSEDVKAGIEAFANGAIKTIGNIIEGIAINVANVVGWISQFVQTVSESGAVQTFAEGCGALATAFGDLFKALTPDNVETVNTVSTNFDDAKKAAQTFADIISALGEGASKAAQGLEGISKWLSTFKKDLESFGVLDTIKETFSTIGESMSKWASAIKKLGRAIGSLIDAFTPLKSKADDAKKSLKPSDAAWGMKSLADWWLTVAKTISKVIDGITHGVHVVADAIDKITGLFNKVPDLSKAFGTATNVFSGPGILSPHGIGTIASLVGDSDAFGILSRKWNDFTSQLSGSWSQVTQDMQGVFGDLGAAIQEKWQAVVDWLGLTTTTIIDFFTGIPDAISGFFGSAGEWIQEKWQALVDWLGLTPTSIIDFFTGIPGDFNDLFQSAKDKITGIFGTVGDWFDQHVKTPIKNVLDAIGNTFQSTKDWIKESWDKVKEAAKSPVKFIVDTVYTNGIKKVWNSVAGAVGLKLSLPDVKFANGGINPGYAPGKDTILAMTSPGEAWMVPEWVKAVGASNIYRWNAMARSQGVGAVREDMGLTPHFAKGGVVSKVTSTLSGATSTVKKWLEDLTEEAQSFVKSPGSWVTSKILDPVKSQVMHISGGQFGQMVGKLPVSVASALVDKAKASASELAAKWVSKTTASGNSSDGGQYHGAVSAGVEQWRSLVLQVLKELGQSESWANTVLRRMNQESGGNPNAINNWDSNAAAGHPSKGLMQTIPSTFAAYAGPYVSRGIYDPLANIYAGVNYALHRYGSLSALNRAGGYALGGIVGDNRPTLYDRGGVLPPGRHLVANETKQPELVLTRDQILKVFGGNAEGGDRTVNMNISIPERTDPWSEAAVYVQTARHQLRG